MNIEAITDLLHFSSQQKPAEFEQAFHAAIADKVERAVNQEKIKVAQGMFKTVETNNAQAA